MFNSTKFKEALIHLDKYGGVLISCDSIKNWQSQDEYFDNATFASMMKAGSISRAKIDSTWVDAMGPSLEDLEKIKMLDISVLISAHGAPLLEKAKKAIINSIDDIAGFLARR